MWVCSGTHSESNPAASAARPSSTGSIVSSVAKIVSPMRIPAAYAATAFGKGSDPFPNAVGSRLDVVVQVEDVAGVVAALDLAQPVVVGAVGVADGVAALVV